MGFSCEGTGSPKEVHLAGWGGGPSDVIPGGGVFVRP